LIRCAAFLAALCACCVGYADVFPPTPDELESYLDGVIGAALADGEAVGATVAVVKDGDVWQTKGYGMADREGEVPVDGAQTLFRVGSVSKVFVWIAVLQQWQSGKLALDTDVNEYLEDFAIPGTFPEPVTLTHMMTHTPGFEDRLIGLFARGPRTADDFHTRLRTMLPRRVLEPGNLATYSNYGAALAAHLVERVSRTGWDDYVEANILQPLGMRATTTRQPPPDFLASRVARGYRWVNDRYEEVPFEVLTLPPAGSASTTAPDMARLLIALLSESGPALDGASHEKMFQRAFAHDPRLNGMTFGMYEQSSHGQRIVGHLGDTTAFHALFLVYPRQRLGLFAAFNSDRGVVVRDRLIRAFEDRWFGAPPMPARVHNAALGAYAGWYRPLRAPESTPTKLVSLLGAVHVHADDDALVVRAGTTRRFYPVGPDLFQWNDGVERIAFRGVEGVKTFLFFDSMPYLAFERATPIRNPELNQYGLLGVFVTFLLAFVSWPRSTFRRLRTRVPVPGEKRATIVAVAQMVACIGYLAAVLSMGGNDPNAVLYGLPDWYSWVSYTPVAIAVLLLLQARYTYLAWTESFWWASRRVHYTLTWLGGVAFVAWCVYWHLVPPALAV
jgi:CubicO group peptidase (beta-lactamase class C family)